MTHSNDLKNRFTVNEMGAVKHLSVLPLIDFYAVDSGLKTEAGVSYLIRADDMTILMDLGANSAKEHPSPLLHNMEALKVSLEQLDMIFITHLHFDHVGGVQDQKQATFSLSQGTTATKEIPVFTPTPMQASAWNPKPLPQTIEQPTILGNGIASTGVVTRKLFLIGLTKEHSLAINVENKGIVIIVGCGHQTAERILDDAESCFEAPIYGIIGGLHFPVNGGRKHIGPFNMQNIVGTDKKPWRGITEADVHRAIERIRQSKLSLVSLSPHDSSDWSLDQFRSAFGAQYQELKVGAEINI